MGDELFYLVFIPAYLNTNVYLPGVIVAMLIGDNSVTKEFEDLKNMVFKIFDEVLLGKKEVILAYSGGKDSTALAILLYEWLVGRGAHPGFKVILLHNDTLSEIEPMESWARNFMMKYKEKLEELGIEVDISITYPRFDETFYWRVLVRGYVAPTNNFRWCVNLLKIKPSKRAYENGGMKERDKIVLVGLRKSESSERSKNFSKKYGSCGIGKCIASYLEAVEEGTINKVAAISNWDSIHVFRYLSDNGFFDVSPLMNLYKQPGLRYGCWHCTLVKYQKPLHILSPRYHYVEALRIVYKLLSDIPIVRMRKDWGYSKYGGLNNLGRHIVWAGISAAERLSGSRFYGLDEISVKETSLRYLFYSMRDDEADRIIIEAETKRDRIVPMSKVRKVAIHEKEKVFTEMEKIMNRRYEELLRNREFERAFYSVADEIMKY